MKNRIKFAAVQIALLESVYTPNELRKAIDLVHSKGVNSILDEYFSDLQANTTTQKKVTKKVKHNLQVTGQTKVVSQLKKKDPQKYEVLSGFDERVRKGEILKTLDDIHELGRSLDKKFVTGKSRKQAVVSLMKCLLSFSTEEIIRITDAVSSDVNEKESSYQRLADFIISGGDKKK